MCSKLRFGRKKSKKLIDTGGDESRFEEIGDNANCITKFFVMMRGKNYFFFFFLSMLTFAIIFTFFSFNKVEWLNNNITLDT